MKQSGKLTLGSLLIALGIIFGDIGTSPLYVVKAFVGAAPPSEALVLGGLSCIFWTLTLRAPLKLFLYFMQGLPQFRPTLFQRTEKSGNGLYSKKKVEYKENKKQLPETNILWRKET